MKRRNVTALTKVTSQVIKQMVLQMKDVLDDKR